MRCKQTGVVCGRTVNEGRHKRDGRHTGMGCTARLLNEEMLEMVRREYQETAERIETKSYYKWQEENKRALSFWGQVSMEIAYGCLSYECIIAEKPYLERIERERARNAVKEPMNVNEEIGSEIEGRGRDGTDALRNGNSRDISNMSKEQLQDNLPEGWTYTEHNGRVHIKDANGNFRVRIDPPDNVTNYQHMHILDELGNPLDIDGNIVSPKSPAGHIPWDNQF